MRKNSSSAQLFTWQSWRRSYSSTTSSKRWSSFALLESR